MTGEMSWIKANGEDSNGEGWPVHAKVARRLRCRLRSFDKYTGPYIVHPRGKLFLSSDDGYSGTACLWPGGVAPAYCEPIVAEFSDVYDADQALEAARRCVKQLRVLSSDQAARICGPARRTEVEPVQRVIFRKWKDTGEVIAFFPDQDEGRGLIGSYQHVGQHGAAAYPNHTIPARRAEYADLRTELKSIGYNLRVVERVSHG